MSTGIWIFFWKFKDGSKWGAAFPSLPAPLHLGAELVPAVLLVRLLAHPPLSLHPSGFLFTSSVPPLRAILAEICRGALAARPQCLSVPALVCWLSSFTHNSWTFQSVRRQSSQ